MNEESSKRLIRSTILTAFARRGRYYLPVAVSARHVHLSKKDFQTLFGAGKTMTRYKDLSQPGQFACEELVEVTGPKGSFKKVRVLGPERKETQVEISVSDCFSLGIKPEFRMSGNIAGSPGCTISGPLGKVTIDEGVIVAARHVHMSEDQAAAFGIKDGDSVSLKTSAPREGIIANIVARVGKEFELEVHLDTDEANGNGLLCGTILETMLKSYPQTLTPHPAKTLDLVTERDINNAIVRGEKIIYYAAKGFASPAAMDRAKEKGITLCKLQE